MLRIGIDIVSIGRLEAALATWPRLGRRIFTEQELRYANTKARPGEHLAARFAAKEATFKALGSGWPKLGWHEVEVISTSSGPRLALRGRAERLAAEAAPVASLSHDGGMAVAQVILVSAL